MNKTPILAVIGGTGLYQFPALKDAQSIEVDTPFGKPSSPIVLGTLAGKKVAFLARHGVGHYITPGEINYRANIYALKALGVKRVLAISACGSLREDYAPGSIIIPNQLFDFTRNRVRSFFGEGLVAHIGVANPFCAQLRESAFKAVEGNGYQVHKGGIFITIEGPRFSTCAESNLYRAWGISIIGMTTSPEAFLAREAELCYAPVAHVTDYDVWHSTEEAVSVEMIIRTLHENTERIQQALVRLVETLQDTPCECHRALEKAIATAPECIPPEARRRLSLLVDKYLPQ